MKFVAIEKVALPRDGEVVHVGLLSAIDEGSARDEFKKIPEDAPDRDRRLMKAFVRRYMANEDRTRRFESDDETVEFLSSHSPREVWQVIAAGQKLNALTDETIEEERKN